MKLQAMLLMTMMAAALALPVAAQPGPGTGPGAGPGTGPANAAPAKGPRYSFDRENTFGWSLMTNTERRTHRAKMLATKTVDECKAAQVDNRKAMEARAKEKGKPVHEPRRDACERMKSRGMLK